MGSRIRANLPPDVLTISRDILEHLVGEPSCQDTFEGLATWWLLKRDLARYSPTLKSATDYLVERQFLNGRLRADGRIHYSLNTSKYVEIREFLCEQANKSPAEGLV